MPKVYEVGRKRPVRDAQLASLRAGVVLDDDPCPCAPPPLSARASAGSA